MRSEPRPSATVWLYAVYTLSSYAWGGMPRRAMSATCPAFTCDVAPFTCVSRLPPEPGVFEQTLFIVQKHREPGHTQDGHTITGDTDESHSRSDPQTHRQDLRQLARAQNQVTTPGDNQEPTRCGRIRRGRPLRTYCEPNPARPAP